jgi:AraC-like DNA-binding protein
VEGFTISINNLVGVLSLFTGAMYFIQLLFSKQLKDDSSKLIVLLFGLLTFVVFFFEAYDNGFIKTSKSLIPLLNAVVLAIGPTLYLYVNSIISSTTFKGKLKHYLPPLVVGLISIILQLFSSIELLKTALIGITVGTLTIGFILQNAYYIFVTLKTYNKHVESIKEIFSYEENVKADWLKVLVFGYLAFTSSIVLVSLIDSPIGEVFFDLVLLVYLAYTGYHAVRQTNIYSSILTNEPLVKTVQDQESIPKEPQDDKLRDLKNEVVRLVEEERLYLNHEVTVFDIATRLSSNSKYVSKAINSNLNKSFIVFINEHRIAESKRLLQDKSLKNYTLEGIGQMAGFKSKSTFNTTFKKMTGATPSEFQKKNSAS